MSPDYKFTKLLTNLFWVCDSAKRFKDAQLKPGVELLASMLIRNGAMEILIPYTKPAYGPPLDEVIEDFPPSLKSRIRIIDKKGRIKQRVLDFFEPLRNDRKGRKLQLDLPIKFLYNLSLASQNEAEADIEALTWVEPIYYEIRDKLSNKEARTRLDELIGLYNLYEHFDHIPVLTIKPKVLRLPIVDRIEELLNEAEFQKYSSDRYLLGVQGKVKSALLSLKKWGRRSLSSKTMKRYSAVVSIAKELIQVVTPYIGSLELPGVTDLCDLNKYSPPLLDLDFYRYQISKQAAQKGGCYFIVRTDGNFSVASNGYFKDYHDFSRRRYYPYSRNGLEL